MSKTKQLPAATLATVDDLAEAFDLTPRRVQQLVIEDVLPKPNKRGEYNWRKCTRAYIEHVRSQNPQSVLKTTISEQKLREIIRDNDQGDWNFAKDKGEFIKMDLVSEFFDQVFPQWGSKIEAVRNRLKGLLKTTVDPEKSATYVDEAINEILSDIGGTNPADYLDPKKTEDVVAESGDALQPVGKRIPQAK